jgi:hypothetical protein
MCAHAIAPTVAVPTSLPARRRAQARVLLEHVPKLGWWAVGHAVTDHILPRTMAFMATTPAIPSVRGSKYVVYEHRE